MFKKSGMYSRERTNQGKNIKQLLNRQFWLVEVTSNTVIYALLVIGRGGQVVRRRSRKPKIAGSNPVRALNKEDNTLLKTGLYMSKCIVLRSYIMITQQQI